MNAMTKVPPEIADTIIAVIIYFTATSVMFKRIWEALFKKVSRGKKDKRAKAAAELQSSKEVE
jgi:simple sugar transport system permease protein